MRPLTVPEPAGVISRVSVLITTDFTFPASSMLINSSYVTFREVLSPMKPENALMQSRETSTHTRRISRNCRFLLLSFF